MDFFFYFNIKKTNIFIQNIKIDNIIFFHLSEINPLSFQNNNGITRDACCSHNMDKSFCNVSFSRTVKLLGYLLK